MLGIRRWHSNDTLLNRFGGHIFSRDLNADRLMQELIHETFNLIWHGGREEENLTCKGRHVENFLNVGDEAHIEHAVSFIDDKGLHTCHENFTAFELVD